MKLPLCTSVVSVFIKLKNLFPTENEWTRFFIRNHYFEMPVNLLDISFIRESLYSYTVLDMESEFNTTFPQKATYNIFKMTSLSVEWFHSHYHTLIYGELHILQHYMF